MPFAVSADSYRIATFAAPLSRDGPGLLLRDIQRGEDPQITAVLSVINRRSPDVLILTEFDYDLDGAALAAIADLTDYPYWFAAQPNTGLPTGLDMDGNGYLGEARDAQGYGRFAGDGGMAVLSRLPIDVSGVRDLSHVLWHDLPGATLPHSDGSLFPSDTAIEVQRLSTTCHWIIPILPPDAPSFEVLAFSATPPVFDGPEDRNGLRNRDELRMWTVALDGEFGPLSEHFVIAGNANLDPVDGQGHSAAMVEFLSDPRLQDPAPGSEGAAAAADPTHAGQARHDTADWPDEQPGNLRVSYVLPSATWLITDAGVFWPARGGPGSELLGDDGMLAGPHHLVWVDISR